MTTTTTTTTTTTRRRRRRRRRTTTTTTTDLFDLVADFSLTPVVGEVEHERGREELLHVILRGDGVVESGENLDQHSGIHLQYVVG
jgi:hypothetical protein